MPNPIINRRTVANASNVAAAPVLPVTSGLLAQWESDSLVLNDNDPVSTWADQSGNARDATQATGSKQPLYKVNLFGTKPGLQFDGTDDELNFSSVGVTAATLCMVWSLVSFPGGDAFSGPFAWNNPSSGVGFLYVNQGQAGSSSNWYNEFQIPGSTYGVDVLTALSIPTVNMLDIWRWDGTTGANPPTGLDKRVNGTNAAITGVGYASGWPNYNSIGNAYLPVQINVGAILVYNRSVTDSERTLIENYLNGKYGVY